ncbi:hypothetical protein BQ8482_380024 [Mesorhizobium delmotii]|uniref:Uncharacterized protein n=1 Tax=Mesorhizobium delmotii TaxID=1631247 RepID=A0A2P9ARP7_9HYPH|nr:hypothetical protein BQ8482_380024 [Mesorhizobium delmotii]
MVGVVLGVFLDLLPLRDAVDSPVDWTDELRELGNLRSLTEPSRWGALERPPVGRKSGPPPRGRRSSGDAPGRSSLSLKIAKRKNRAPSGTRLCQIRMALRYQDTCETYGLRYARPDPERRADAICRLAFRFTGTSLPGGYREFKQI